VYIAVASVTKGDEVTLRIFTRVAAKLLMVDLQVRHRSTRLTAPIVATQDLSP